MGSVFAQLGAECIRVLNNAILFGAIKVLMCNNPLEWGRKLRVVINNYSARVAEVYRYEIFVIVHRNKGV